MKPVLISGIQPTGRLHIGNYLGALKNFVELQNSGKYQCYFFIADLHALTENPDAKELNKNIIGLASDFLAAGLDSKKSVIFQQSQISAHVELTWILNTITPMGELRRMTQFKQKVLERTREKLMVNAEDMVKNKTMGGGVDMQEFENLGLFGYPVLMAADIMLYDTEFVPVGDDQLQHLELTRTIARKFNKKFGKTFIEPQPILTKTPRVMSLMNPEKKMSKSQPEGCLFMDDEPEVVKNKIARAVTDSNSEIKYDSSKKAGVSNLLEIYSSLSGKKISDIEKKFKGKGYGELKKSLAELVSDHFADFRKKKKELLAKPQTLKSVLKSGSEKANRVAGKKVKEVKEKVGLI